MKASIIIPSFKRAELLKWGLKCIRQQKVDFDYEIIVLNDGIEDDTEKVCKEYKAEYHFTGQRNTNGLVWRCPGPVINKGASIARSGIFVLAVPEMYLAQNNILQSLVSAVEANERVIAITQGYDDTGGRFLEHINKGGEWQNSDQSALVNLHTEYPFFMCLSRQAFNEVRGYDVEGFSNGIGFDDTDFILRLRQKYYTYVKYQGLSVVHLYHDRHSRQGLDFIKQQELFEINKNYYLSKHGGGQGVK